MDASTPLPSTLREIARKKEWEMSLRREERRLSECPDCYGIGVIQGELCPLCKGRKPTR